MIHKDLSTRSWKSLSAQDKINRKIVIEVLRRLRIGENLTHIIKEVGISKDLVRKHASLYLSEDELNG